MQRKIAKLLKAWESNAAAEVGGGSACEDAPGLPGQECAAAAWNGVGCGQPRPFPQEPHTVEHVPTVLCPQGDSVVAAAHRGHRKASDDLTFAVTPAECGVLSPA